MALSPAQFKYETWAMLLKFRRYTALNDAELYPLLFELVRIGQQSQSGMIVAGTADGGDCMMLKHLIPRTHLTVIDSFRGVDQPSSHDGNTDVFAGRFDQKGKDDWLSRYVGNGGTPPDKIYEMWISPTTLQAVRCGPVSAIWLDCDHYAPTRAVLNRFWGDLEPGGRVFVHDYLGRGTPGVRKACDEFAVERGLNPWKILVPSEYGIVYQLRGNNNQGGEHA